jgi:hypothetical protein
LINGSASVSINENDSVTVTGTFTDTGTVDAHAVAVNWGNGDTTYATVSPTGPGSWSFIAIYTYLDDGASPGNGTALDNYSITVTVTDDDFGTDTDASLDVTVNNVSPVATILGAPLTSPEGTTINLASNVVDPGSIDVQSYLWTVTKNAAPYATATTPTFSFTPNDDATYLVTLTVTDDDGGFSTDSATITVTNVAPQVALTGAGSVNEAALYTLNIGAITDPGTDTVTQYIVHWGDGSIDVYSSGGSKTHTYIDDDLVTSPITVDVIDEDGYHAAAGTLNRTVNNVAPTGFLINSGPVNEGATASVFVVGQSDVSSKDITDGFTYGYDFNNDGDFTDPGEIASTTATSAVVPATYLSDNPNRVVRVEIRDDDGGVTSLFTTITINNVAPIVNAGADATAYASVSFSQTITFTDPGSDSPWSVSVDWNGDTIYDDF